LSVIVLCLNVVYAVVLIFLCCRTNTFVAWTTGNHRWFFKQHFSYFCACFLFM